MREQSFIGDKQFLKSMIPHHSGAILMCNEAKLSDPEIVAFCKEIVEAQEKEITIMKKMLEEKFYLLNQLHLNCFLFPYIVFSSHSKFNAIHLSCFFQGVTPH
jgi:hypothetical protein